MTEDNGSPIPRPDDAVYGDDDKIIGDMTRVQQRLADRIDKIRGTSNTAGLDPQLAEILHGHMQDTQTHLTSGSDIAQVNMDQARSRMDIASEHGSRVRGLNTSIGTPGVSGGMSPMRPSAGPGISASAQPGPRTRRTVPQGPSYSTPITGSAPKAQAAPQPAPQQPAGATHTSAGGYQPVTNPNPAAPAGGYSAPRYNPPQFAAPGNGMTPPQVPSTAYAPSTVNLPTSPQQGAGWYDQARQARQQAMAANQARQAMNAQQARALAAAQNQAYHTPQAQSERARGYLNAADHQQQQAERARANASAEAYREQQEHAREQQRQAAESLREQQRRESQHYREMMAEMNERRAEDLPERKETSGRTIDDFSEKTPTLFDSHEDSGQVLPREVYNDMIQEILAETEADEHESNQASSTLGMNKDELQDKIYEILKEEDEAREQEAMASGPATATGEPSGAVGPVSGSADDQAAIELANEYVAANIPYAWGGGHGAEPGPSQGISDGGGYADQCGDYNKIGLDCSGLARDFTWNMYGVDINGTAASQYASGMPVAPEDARPGDIFFPDSAGRPPMHVTVYIGNNSMLEAQQSGTMLMISPLPSGEFRRYVQ